MSLAGSQVLIWATTVSQTPCTTADSTSAGTSAGARARRLQFTPMVGPPRVTGRPSRGRAACGVRERGTATRRKTLVRQDCERGHIAGAAGGAGGALAAHGALQPVEAGLRPLHLEDAIRPGR